MTKVYSLHRDVNDRIKYQYSAQKYGDINALAEYSSELNDLILREKIITSNSVILLTMKYPYSSEYKKNFVILAEKIAKMNNLPMATAFYDHNPDPKSFYDNQEQAKRKAVVGRLNEVDKKKFKNFNFIAIEDSIMTGTTIKAIQKSLEGIAKSISIVSILDLRNKNYQEKELNEYFYNKEGLEGLIKLFKNDSYIITTQMLRTFGTLEKSDKEVFLKNIPNPDKLLSSYKSYFGKSSFLFS